MKKILFFLSLTFLFFSCDKIENPIKETGDICGNCSDSLAEYVTEQNVLIEEFTGIKCNNCPLAASEIKRLQGLHNERIIAIGIHASSFAIPDSGAGYTADFRTVEGTEIYNFAAPVGIPAGLINRLDYATPGFNKFFQSWENAVNKVLQNDQAPLGIYSTLSINADSTELCMESWFKALEDLSGRNLYWSAFITESGIVAAQKLPDNSKDPDYVHNHVLRAGFNGSTGELANYPPLDFAGNKDEAKCTSRSLKVKPEWVIENLTMVVYVYDYDTKEVLQVVETHL